MKYAIIENGTVTNIIVLYPINAEAFPDAVPCGDIPAAIGDSWDGTYFYRNGERVLSAAETARQEAEDMQAALSELGVTVDG